MSHASFRLQKLLNCAPTALPAHQHFHMPFTYATSFQIAQLQELTDKLRQFAQHAYSRLIEVIFCASLFQRIVCCSISFSQSTIAFCQFPSFESLLNCASTFFLGCWLHVTDMFINFFSYLLFTAVGLNMVSCTQFPLILCAFNVKFLLVQFVQGPFRSVSHEGAQ